MMAYLTRPGFNGGGSSEVVEIDFGSAEDKAFQDMMKAYKYYLSTGGKKSLKDYMRMSTGAGKFKGGGREHFRATGGRVNLADGTEEIVEPPKSMQMDTTTSNPIPEYDITDFRNDAEIFVLAYHNNTLPTADIADRLNAFAKKGVDAGTFTMQEAADAVKDLQLYVKDRARYQRLRDVVPEGIGTVEREERAIGGGVIEGEDLGTREGFNRPLIPVSELPKDQQKYINNWLKNNPDKKWEELTNNQRNMLKKGQNVGVGYGATTPKGADNPLFEPLSKKGEEIAKKVYGTTDISKEKRLRINRGEITMDTKPVKFEKGKGISLKMKRGSEKPTDIVFPDKQMEKDFIKAIRARVLQPQKAVVDFSNKELAELFPISEKQAGRAVRYFVDKLNLKYATVPSKTSADIIKNTKNLIKQTSSFLQENRIRSAKTNILQDLDLQKKMDTAHRVSKTHMAKLGLEFNTDIMGIDSRLINQIIVKPSEIQLDRLYRKQYDIFEKLKKNPNSTELKNNLKDINKQVTDIVKNTSGRLVGVTIDPDTLETSFQGIKKKYSFSNVLGDSMTMKELENIPKEDQVKFLTKQLPKAIDLEVKRGFVPNDFKNILSNPDSQKSILNYAKQKAPELIAPLKKAFLNPTSKVSLKLFSQFPAITTAGLVGYGAYKGMGFDQEVRADDMSKPIDPGVAVSQEQTDTGIPAEAVAAGSVGAVKYGPQLLKILQNVGRGTIKTLGSLPAAVGYAGLETKAGMDEGKSFTDAVTEPMVGLNLLLPETVKKLGPLMAKGARISTPVGATITGIGTLKNRAQAMMQEADALTKTPYQEDLIDEYAAKQYRGYELGGRVGFADGPDDPSKRKFMKILGGLTALPFVGKFFKTAEPIAEVAPKIVETAKGAPPYFFKLVDKIKKFGEDVTRQLKSSEREQVTSYRTSDADYELYEDLNTGSQQIKIRKGDPDGSGGYKEQELTLTKGQSDESAGVVPDEYDEYTVRPDDDGKLKDVEEGIEDIDDLIDELGPENISVKELQDMGYDVDRLGPVTKKKLGIK